MFVLCSCGIEVDEIGQGVRLPKRELSPCHAAFCFFLRPSPMSSYSPSPFPTSCRPIPSALAPPTTFTEEFLPPYFYFSLIGFTAFHESLDLCVAFRDKYPRSQRREDQVTAVFLQDRAHLVASLACVYAIAGFRDRIHENALKAARADVDAMLELMTDDFVGAWGPSRVPGACTRRRQALIRAAQRAQGAAYYAARLQQAQDAAELAHQADADIHQAPLVLDDQPVSLPSTWGTATTSEGGWGVPTTTTNGSGTPLACGLSVRGAGTWDAWHARPLDMGHAAAAAAVPPRSPSTLSRAGSLCFSPALGGASWGTVSYSSNCRRRLPRCPYFTYMLSVV
ncbi:hypothetical protein C8F04DRAFT_1269942 [Mycena alexandri]|uniref:Uncharacterized protein n=1 Tax=Mycena alexandri TaxID=1745969 RepID=A0AAD6SEX0_9AGAR|nr:hypothetical protein C8F04DRAFT_1269942 [Mycena alexandri]